MSKINYFDSYFPPNVERQTLSEKNDNNNIIDQKEKNSH